jgi:putative Holliday junction resolvase
LALDVGSKRIGLAVSDELGFIAQALKTLDTKGRQRDIDSIIRIVNEMDVSEIVVGMPYNMNGSEGPQAQKVSEFADQLSRATSVPVLKWDERMSTLAAEKILLEADLSRLKRRKVIDKVAAAIILQGYLDSKRT